MGNLAWCRARELDAVLCKQAATRLFCDRARLAASGRASLLYTGSAELPLSHHHDYSHTMSVSPIITFKAGICEFDVSPHLDLSDEATKLTLALHSQFPILQGSLRGLLLGISIFLKRMSSSISVGAHARHLQVSRSSTSLWSRQMATSCHMNVQRQARTRKPQPMEGSSF